MITPKLKDAVLNHLIEQFNNDKEIVHTHNLALELNTKPSLIDMILEQFHQQSLLQDYVPFLGEDDAYFELNANAFDLHHLGGFTGKEELLKLNLKKLELEVNSLKQSAPDTAEKITSILANIATVAGFLLK